MASASGRWLEQVRLESTDAMVAWDTSCITCWRSRTGFFWGGDYVMNYKCQATASVGSCQEAVRTCSSSKLGIFLWDIYMKPLWGELGLPHPEGRKAWLRAEIESLFLKRSSHDKPPLLDVCYSLNVEAANAGGQLSKKELVTNAVEKLMSETRHVVESASSSAS